MSQKLLEVRGIQRSFKEVKALRDISFTIEQGQIVGFIGSNGSGKTTTMKIIVGIDIPDRGEVLIHGKNLLEYRQQYSRTIGWMPDSLGAYDVMSVSDYLDFFSRAYGMKGKQRTQRIKAVTEFLEIENLLSRDCVKLSKGQAQRLGLARALLPDPEILVLDEPAAGLDPKARIDFKHLIKILAQQGKTMLISSHILSELEDMCTSMLFINKGVIAHQGSAENLKRENAEFNVIDIRFVGTEDRLIRETLSLHDGFKVLEPIKDGLRVQLPRTGDLAQSKILKELIIAGVEVIEFKEHTRRLEDAFVDLVEDSVTSTQGEGK